MKTGSPLAFCCITQQTREETGGKVNRCFSIALLLMHILDAVETLEHRRHVLMLKGRRNVAVRRHGERESERREKIKGGNGEKNRKTQAVFRHVRRYFYGFF